ncbi:hypothetical protein M0R45_030141 [Rubus argutus]|uniref:Uncharacterized protein n=1 Tax=Rubus argutus TaxID=59490 RepID=A0AAW1WAM5_RUBAR
MEEVNNEDGQPEINTMVLLNAMSVEEEVVREVITDDSNALKVFVDIYVHSSRDIIVLSSMVDAGAIVEMDEEMMHFMNSHSQSLEEAEIATAHLTMSIWAGKLLGRKFTRPWSWPSEKCRHDKMNFSPEMQEIIVFDDETEDKEIDQASEGEFLVFEGEDAAESDQEVIVVSEDNDDMGGDAAKSESSEEEEDHIEEDIKDGMNTGSSESASKEQEGQA